jgi:hypothetical protein
MIVTQVMSIKVKVIVEVIDNYYNKSSKKKQNKVNQKSNKDRVQITSIY